MKYWRPVAMLAEMSLPHYNLKALLLYSVLGCSSLLLAADTEQPDTGLLEYLGLWEESDADWMLFADAMIEPSDEKTIADDAQVDVDLHESGLDQASLAESKDES